MHRIALRTPALFPRPQLKKTIRVPIFQLDAFASAPFKGNPAAVCPLDSWLPDETLVAIAAENNLSETAFVVPESNGSYHLRWFTPTVEVNCCGHATLATAALIMGKLEPQRQSVAFETKSGKLVVNRAAKAAAGPAAAAAPGAALPQLTLDFPPWPVGAELEAPPADLVAALNGPKAPTRAFPIEPLHGATRPRRTRPQISCERHRPSKGPPGTAAAMLRCLQAQLPRCTQ